MLPQHTSQNVHDDVTYLKMHSLSFLFTLTHGSALILYTDTYWSGCFKFNNFWDFLPELSFAVILQTFVYSIPMIIDVLLVQSTKIPVYLLVSMVSNNVAGLLNERGLSCDASLMLSIRGRPAHCRTVVLNNFDSQGILTPQLSTTIYSPIRIKKNNNNFRAWHNKKYICCIFEHCENLGSSKTNIYIAACSNYGAKPIVAILAYLNFWIFFGYF